MTRFLFEYDEKPKQKENQSVSAWIYIGLEGFLEVVFVHEDVFFCKE